MTQTKLDDLMQKSIDKTLTISDLGEICGALLESSSRHSKDLKIKINHLEQNILELKKEFLKADVTNSEHPLLLE